MRPIVESYARYKGSKKSFCQERGIAIHTLDYWRSKFKKPEVESASFIALEVDAGTLDQAIELHYPNGVRATVPVSVPEDVLQSLLNFGC